MPSHRSADLVVDTKNARSVWFARPDERPSSVTERPPIAVGPGRPGAVPAVRSGPLPDEPTRYPLQIAKVQPPALRDETLERPRLLDWLRAKANHRVILVTADAGFGKTTLLGDFSRRTRLRTLWYRLDAGDRDWATLIRHLVAAGREHLPEFATTTSSMLAEVGVGGPSRDAVLETFIRELSEIVDSGAVLIFDDFHFVDDAPDARDVLRTLVAKGPDRLTVIVASRRVPPIPLAKLRAVGEVADIGTDELRFDLDETSQLFTETYGRAMDAESLGHLASRTEGWIASLQLVHAALRNRSPAEVRHFVRDLSGASSDLYDYLAEEVIADLPERLQRFLMTTSILEVVNPEMATVVSDEPEAEVLELMAEAERLTLLSRVSGGPRRHLRYHPLVREFLEARLYATDGDLAVDALHRKVAMAAAATDWQVAAHHYRQGGDIPAMLAVIDAAVPTIMGNAQYNVAASYASEAPEEARPLGALLIQGRVDMQRGEFEHAATASRRVLESPDLGPDERDYALLNLLSSSFNSGDVDRALEHAEALRTTTSNPGLRAIAEATMAIINLSSEQDLDDLNRQLHAMAREQRGERPHHFGVTELNLANASVVQDRLEDALREVDEALEAFTSTSAEVERTTAVVTKAAIYLRLGRADDAEDLIAALGAGSTPIQNEALLEAAEAFGALGSPARAAQLFQRVAGESRLTIAEKRLWATTRAQFDIRAGRGREAIDVLQRYPVARGTTYIGSAIARTVLLAHASVVAGEPDAESRMAAAHTASTYAGIHGARRLAQILHASCIGPEPLGRAIVEVGFDHPWHISWVAETIAPNLDSLDNDAIQCVARAAQLHQDRWRKVLRQGLDSGQLGVTAATILESIGQRPDIARLRGFARAHRRSPRAAALGRSLARRLADRVFVEDQGRVSIRVGDREVPGTSIRRKVLALLCYLLARPGASATKDQVLDTIWPDLDPQVAVNSLNQTLYFLRRVFEEDYAEELSPGYVHHDNDILWLDEELVTSRSIESRRLLSGMSVPPDPAEVSRLSATYHGRFALDFEYEEWAMSPRDTLHAAYLEVIERAVRSDLASGHYDRAIRLARRALELDDTAEEIEISLLRLYRTTGAHGAAAEQYERYSHFVRTELGAEPPPLDAL